MNNVAGLAGIKWNNIDGRYIRDFAGIGTFDARVITLTALCARRGHNCMAEDEISITENRPRSKFM